jgi:DNA-binding transcriptional LysR family regulator
MDLKQLNTFRAVATARNFTRAAEELHYAQSTVTAQIQAIEKELGIRLFERLGKRVALTDAGERLLKYTERLLALTDEARVAVSGNGEPHGVLTIGAAETLCTYRLPALLQRFCGRYPGVQVIIQPATRRELRQTLLEGRADVSFLLEEPVSAADLVVLPLIREPLCVIAAPDHPLTHAHAVAPADMEGQSLLLTEPGCSYREQFERALADAGVRAAATVSFSNIEALKQCVMAGMGIGVLLRVAVATEIARGRLAALEVAGPSLSVFTQVAWHRDKWLSPALRAFLKLTLEVLGRGDAGAVDDGPSPPVPVDMRAEAPEHTDEPRRAGASSEGSSRVV